MELLDKQFEQIEKLSGCNYSPEQIAMYLGVDKNDFLKEWNIKDSPVRYRYNRGLLIVQAESDMKLVDSAKAGNITAHQQWMKARTIQNIENLKKKQRLDAEITDVDNLKKYIESGSNTGLDKVKEEQYEMLEFCRKLYEGHESESFIVGSLLKSFPNKIASRKHAKNIYNESINFFNCDNSVKREAWLNYYAERFEETALIAREINDFEIYYKLLKEAKDCRLEATKDNGLPEEFYRKQFVIYVTDPKKIGLPEASRKDVAEFIDKLDISETDKLRIRKDAMPEEIELDLIPEQNAKD